MGIYNTLALTLYNINDKTGIFVRMKVKHISYRTIRETWTENWNIILQKQKFHNNTIQISLLWTKILIFNDFAANTIS